MWGCSMTSNRQGRSVSLQPAPASRPAAGHVQTAIAKVHAASPSGSVPAFGGKTLVASVQPSTGGPPPRPLAAHVLGAIQTCKAPHPKAAPEATTHPGSTRALQPKTTAAHVRRPGPASPGVAQRAAAAAPAAAVAAAGPSASQVVLVVGCGWRPGVCEEAAAGGAHNPARHYLIDIRASGQPDKVADITGSFASLGLPAGHFEIVFFENVDVDVFTRPATYANAYALLKSGGQVRIQTGSGQFLISAAGGLMPGPGPEVVMNTLEARLQEAGFTDVASKSLAPLQRNGVAAVGKKP
jgi:hypothetical protein